MQDSMDEGEQVEVAIHGAIPQRDLFHRGQPALEGPEENWALAEQAISFGCALFAQWRQIRADQQLRDAVLQALLRRSLVTTEGLVVLLGRGLLEPAIATSRTLLDTELAVRLVLGDPTNRMAKRLAAYHYLTYQQHGQDMLADPVTRKGPLSEAGRVPEVASVASSYKRFLMLPIFDDVRDELRSSRYWHGYLNAEEAFRAVGKASDYFMLYDVATWFVHDINVDFDYSERTDSELLLKPLVERDPAVIQLNLGQQLLRLVTICRLIVEDRGYPSEPPFDRPSTVTFPDGSVEQINGLEALEGQLVAHFNLPRRVPSQL
jgi:hypothetical protein